jgi:hypothetical protein
MLRYAGVPDAFEVGHSHGGNDIGWVSKLPCLTDLLDDSGAWQSVYRGEDNFSGVGHMNVDIADKNAESPITLSMLTTKRETLCAINSTVCGRILSGLKKGVT